MLPPFPQMPRISFLIFMPSLPSESLEEAMIQHCKVIAGIPPKSETTAVTVLNFFSKTMATAVIM